MHKHHSKLYLSLIISLTLITVSCTTNKVVPSKYVLPPLVDDIPVANTPNTTIDADTLDDLQQVLISWQKQTNLTKEQQIIVKALSGYNDLIFDWQKWSTLTILDKNTTIALWKAWAEDVQTATQGKAVNK